MAHRQHFGAQRHSQDARLAGGQFVERRQTLCNAFPAIDPAHLCRGDRPWWHASLVESSLGSETALWICGLLLAPAGGTEFLPNQSPSRRTGVVGVPHRVASRHARGPRLLPFPSTILNGI